MQTKRGLRRRARVSRMLSCLLAACLAAGVLAGCEGAAQRAEIVLLTSPGPLEASSFSQSAWDGVRLYAGMNDRTSYYYQPAGDDEEAREETLERAILVGAQLVLMAGTAYADTAATAQEAHPDVSFVLLGGEPTGGCAANTSAAEFAVEQAGYLAGYAAVAEGYTALGFLGEGPDGESVAYGLGFAQGANAAGKKLDVKVTLRYDYSSTAAASADRQQHAADWYKEGTQVIFACGEQVDRAVVAAASALGSGRAKVIGAGEDRSGESETVLVSALPVAGAAAAQLLKAYYTDAFPGGETLRYGTAEGAVALAMENARLRQFTQADYDTIYAKLAAGKVHAYTAAKGEEEMPLSPAGLGLKLNYLDLQYEYAA